MYTCRSTVRLVCTKNSARRGFRSPSDIPDLATARAVRPFADITTENARRLTGALPTTSVTMALERRYPGMRMQWQFSVCPTLIRSRSRR